MVSVTGIVFQGLTASSVGPQIMYIPWIAAIP